MKRKTSVTLSEDLIELVDRTTTRGGSRSATIERLLRESIAARVDRAVDARELALINRHAEQLNAEAEDVLDYQAES